MSATGAPDLTPLEWPLTFVREWAGQGFSRLYRLTIPQRMSPVTPRSNPGTSTAQAIVVDRMASCEAP